MAGEFFGSAADSLLQIGGRLSAGQDGDHARFVPHQRGGLLHDLPAGFEVVGADIAQSRRLGRVGLHVNQFDNPVRIGTGCRNP